MSWIPQNVQKRAFHYVLNRLALFSDLQLDYMDVSLGSSQRAVLHNVKLDTDRFSLPAGMYMRSGSIDELVVEIQLLGGGGICVSLDGLKITASMKQMDMESATEHMEELLERTTADLAASILSDDISASLQFDPAEDPPLVGMGTTPNLSEKLTRKITQAVLGQLSVSISNLSLTLFVAADNKVDVMVDAVKIIPKGGEEMAMEIRGFKIAVKEKPETTASETMAHATTGFTSESESDSDTYSDAKKSLFQSTIFSQQEASSIYMSAIAESAMGLASEKLSGVFFIDTIDILVFLGDEDVRVTCTMGTVRVSLELFPTVMRSLVHIGSSNKTYGGVRSKPRETEEIDDSPGRSVRMRFTLKTVEVSPCALDEQWQFEDLSDTLLMSISDISVSSADFVKLQAGVCEVRRGSKQVLRFCDDELDESEPRDPDLLLKYTPDSLTVVVPKKAVGEISITDLVDFVTHATDITSIMQSKPGNNKKTHNDSQTKVTFQTNTFELNVGGQQMYILPLRFADAKLTISRVSFAGINFKAITLEENLVLVNRLEFVVSPETLRDLIGLFQPVIDVIQRFNAKQTISQVANISHQLLRIVEEPEELPRKVIQVSTIQGTMKMRKKLGDIELTLGDIRATGPLDKIEVATVEISRDLTDIGLSRKKLIHPLKRVSTERTGHRGYPLTQKNNVTVEFADGQIQLVTVNNCCLEFYTELLQLLGPDEEVKSDKEVDMSDTDSMSESNSVDIRDSPRIPLQIHNCAIGLNPTNSSASAQFIVKHVTCEIKHTPHFSMTSFLGSASVLLIDDVSLVTLDPNDLLSSYLDQYCSVASLTATSLSVSSSPGKPLSINVNGDTLTVSTCADSLQTLIHLFNSLKPPVEFSGPKFQLQTSDPSLNAFEDVDDFFFKKKRKDASESSCSSDTDDIDLVPDDVPSNMSFVESYYGGDQAKPILSKKSRRQKMADSYTHADFLLDADLDTLVKRERVRFEEICFEEDYFDNEEALPPASRPRALSNDLSSSNELLSPPTVVIQLDLMHNIVCNFHDGYDWHYTRSEINGAVDGLKKRMKERNPVMKEAHPMTTDLLFNSVYIQATDIDELDQVMGRKPLDKVKTGKLRENSKLYRSPKPMVQICLHGIAGLATVYASVEDTNLPPGQVINALDVKIKDVEIIDHVPTSTWNKFLTYMRSRGEREAGAVMVHVTMQNVKPVPNLLSQEVICHVAVLPLRLHVDQDTLDFLTRFFSFKDARMVAPPDETFVQKFDIRDIPVKLDYKPKKVDYAGLRSGKSTELMNFFILEEADIVLRRMKLHGITGFANLGQKLNDIWMPDVRKTQLPGVLAGVAPVRPLVNLGGGIHSLIVVPVREYKKDGRIVRSLNQGAYAFAKTTTNELVRFGAKLAVGTQNLLEGVVGGGETREEQEPSEESSTTKYYTYMGYSDSTNKHISLYANQPLGVYAGLQEAYSSFGKHMSVAKTAIHNLGEDISEADTAGAAAYAVVKAAPVALIRPIIGTTEAVSKTLFGVANEMDPSGRELARDKYKEDK